MLTQLVLLGCVTLGGASPAYFNEYHKHWATAKDLKNKMNLKMAHYEPKPVPRSHDDDESDGCKMCWGGVIKWVAEHVKKWLDEECEKPESKKMQEFCDFNRKAPQVVAGMFIFWTRPFQSAEAYCIGAKACEPKNSIEESPADMATRKLNDMVSDVDLGESFDLAEEYAAEKKLGVLRVNHFMAELEMSNFEQKEEDFLQVEGHPKPDPKCMGDVMKHIMVVVIKKVAAWCEKEAPKCPKAKKVCEWAGSHKGEAYGYILAAVEPWKTGYGYCFPHEEARLRGREDSIYA